MEVVSIIGAVLSLVGSVAAGRMALRANLHETDATSESGFRRDLLARVEALEEDRDALHHQVFCAERRAHNLYLALTRGLDALKAVAGWAASGAVPPPPDVTATIASIEDAIARVDSD